MPKQTQIPKTATTNFEIGGITSRVSRLVNSIRSGPDPSCPEGATYPVLRASIPKRRRMTISHRAIGRASTIAAPPAKDRRPSAAESVPESPASNPQQAMALPGLAPTWA